MNISRVDHMEKSMAQKSWNAKKYKAHGRFVPQHGAPVLELLAPRPGEKILDLGCGDGVLTAKIAGMGCTVLGVDSSPDMLRAAEAAGVNTRLLDGEQLDFFEQFDAVFSNAALHWILRPQSVVQGVWRALKPGGRFVGEFGGHGNVATVIGAFHEVFADQPALGKLRNLWYFPTTEAYRGILVDAGFSVSTIALIPRPTPLENGIENWLQLFFDGITAHLPPADQRRVYKQVIHKLKPRLYHPDQGWVADYVRLRFEAVKTAE